MTKLSHRVTAKTATQTMLSILRHSGTSMSDTQVKTITKDFEKLAIEKLEKDDHRVAEDLITKFAQDGILMKPHPIFFKSGEHEKSNHANPTMPNDSLNITANLVEFTVRLMGELDI